jgi:PPM family protein phosphatase
MSDTTCTRCGAPAVPEDRFCEGCGAVLSGIRRVAVPGASPQGPAVCADCGNGEYVDHYCSVCGQRRAEPDRDEAGIDPIVLVTDRGLVHDRNEDAAAAGIVECGQGQRPYAIAVAVCDGVSTSVAAHTAARSASIVGVDTMLTALAASEDARSAVLAGLADAAVAAAKVGANSVDPTMAPSCTYAAAAVVPIAEGTVQIAVGNVGDSRVYWLPEPPSAPECLTVDDSLAHDLIAAGVPADSDAVLSGAHTLTKWFGADSGSTPWSESSVRTIVTADAGLLLLCTDGLWNYLPDAEDISQICAGLDATAAASALVEYALREGGQDNITVAVIPIGGQP